MNSEEVRTTSSTGGMKGVKPQQHSLIPVEALNQVAELYGRGAAKYGAPHNWRKGYDWSKSYDALQRHATAFWGGEDIDEETGMPHMACVAFHSFTLLTFMQEQQNFDDRYKPEDRGEKVEEKGYFEYRLDGVTEPERSEEAIATLRSKLTGEPVSVLD